MDCSTLNVLCLRFAYKYLFLQYSYYFYYKCPYINTCCRKLIAMFLLLFFFRMQFPYLDGIMTCLNCMGIFLICLIYNTDAETCYQSFCFSLLIIVWFQNTCINILNFFRKLKRAYCKQNQYIRQTVTLAIFHNKIIGNNLSQANFSNIKGEKTSLRWFVSS